MRAPSALALAIRSVTSQRSSMSNFDAPPNSVGWHILEGYPWWPVYICDATKLRPNLHLLGTIMCSLDCFTQWRSLVLS